jgi:UPF0716 protein FxsA
MGLAYLIIFLLWGWAEMSAFIFVGNVVGGLLTLLGIFVTAIIGIALLKQQGLAVLARIRTEIRDGRAPVTSVAASVALAFGGVLMLIPGYVTDAIGLFLFVPGIRTIAGVYLMQWLFRNRRFQGSVHVGGGFAEPPLRPHYHAADDIIEGEAKERPAKTRRLPEDR